MSITTEVEHHDIDKSADICLQKSCEEEVEPTYWEFGNDILYMESDFFFNMDLMSMKVLMWVFLLNMNPFLLSSY